jgi:DNA-binding MarR family transcriptional regulator
MTVKGCGYCSRMPSHAPSPATLGGGSLLHRVGRELSTTTDRMLRESGLTSQQAALLLHASRGSCTPSELAGDLGTDTAGATRLLDRVEALGLIRRSRHPADRRSVTVDLTDAGRALVPRVAPVFGRVTARLFDGFSAAETALVTDLLQRMLANLTRPVR